MVSMLTFQRLQFCIRQFEAFFMKWIASQGCHQVPFDRLAIDFSPETVTDRPLPEDNTTENRSLSDIFKDGFLWSEPKSRRSRERRKIRRFGSTYIEKWATPRKDIVACLQCGHYHEKDTICGNCYKIVRFETKKMMRKMGDKLKYNVPHKEVVVLYEEEKDDRPKYEGKYIVEMKKPRPKWFADALMKKVSSKP